MRIPFILAVIIIISVSILTGWQYHLNHTVSAADTIADSTSEADILTEVMAYNNVVPKAGFRKGHVEKTKFRNHPEETAYGYVLQLGSQTNIPTPAVVGDQLYVSGGFGSREYYALQAKTGKVNWAIHLDDDGPSSPAIQDNIIVFNTESCTIFACDSRTGEQLWSYYLGDPLMSMPAIVNGMVFTAYPAQYSEGGKPARTQGKAIPTHVMIAIELSSGKILWQRWIDSDVMSAPVSKGDDLYVVCFSGSMYRFKQKTGEILEAKSIRGTSAPVFTAAGEMIVSRRADRVADTSLSEVVVVGMGTARKNIYRKKAEYLDRRVQEKTRYKGDAAMMDAGNGFTSGAPSSANSSAAYMNIGLSNVSALQAYQGSRALYIKGRMYNTMGDELICTDHSGKTIWKKELQGNLKEEGGVLGTPPIYANGRIIIATLKGKVMIFKEDNGALYKEYNIKDGVRYQPVVHDGWIYVTSVSGKLHAINTGDNTITGWNMWGGNAARTNTPQ
jgi:Ca-activated chloride channel homolog